MDPRFKAELGKIVSEAAGSIESQTEAMQQKLVSEKSAYEAAYHQLERDIDALCSGIPELSVEKKPTDVPIEFIVGQGGPTTRLNEITVRLKSQANRLIRFVPEGTAFIGVRGKVGLQSPSAEIPVKDRSLFLVEKGHPESPVWAIRSEAEPLSARPLDDQILMQIVAKGLGLDPK